MTQVWYTATQPMLFPPMHMLERMYRVDHFVLMHEAQIDRKTLHVNLIGANGRMMFTPDLIKGNRNSYGNCNLLDFKFIDKLRKATDLTYAKFEAYRSLQESWHMWLDAAGSLHNLFSLCYSSLLWTARAIRPQDSLNVSISRSLVPDRQGTATQWLVDLGLALKATDYMQGGTGLRGYIDVAEFQTAGIRLWEQSFKHPYAQDISVLDILFRYGPSEVAAYARPHAGRGNSCGTMERFA